MVRETDKKIRRKVHIPHYFHIYDTNIDITTDIYYMLSNLMFWFQDYMYTVASIN